MRRAWPLWLGAGVLATGVHAALPATVANDRYDEAIALVAALVVLTRLCVGTNRPIPPWRWIGAAVALHAAGALTETDLGRVSHSTPYPSVADGLYLSGYVAAFVGCVLLLRVTRVGKEGSAAVEALLVGLAVTVASWRLVIVPSLGAGGSHLSWLVGVSYPAADVLIACLLTRLALEGERRDISLQLLGASLLCLFLSDIGFAATSAQGTYENGQWTDSVALLFCILAVAAVLHPASAERPRAAVVKPVSQGRLLLAGVCGLSGPVLLLLLGAHERQILRVAAFGTVLLLALVLWRSNRLLLRMHRTAETLRHSAQHDPLTALPNRQHFHDLVGEALARRDRASERDAGPATEAPLMAMYATTRACEVAVLRFDLDAFKTVNDTAGHLAGDALLLDCSQRLTRMAGPLVVGRLGGDEFGVLVTGQDVAARVEELGEQVLASLREPFDVGGRSVPMRASMGSAWGERGVAAADELLGWSDIAMATAKSVGGGCLVAFEPSLTAAVMALPAMVAQLERALRLRELEMVYQPLVSLPSERITGFEALVRWRLDGRLLAPAEFLPAAHASGLIVDIDRAVLRMATSQLASWRSGDRDARGLAMSVNMSVRTLEWSGIVTEVLDVLAEFDIPAGLLTIEVTEEAAAGATSLRDRLEYLRRCGVRVALDDFGTGYSSLAYLEGFPADVLKVAKPLVDPLVSPQAPSRVLAGLVQLARSCDFEVLAEGVETREQCDRLVALGVERGQGYLFARPCAPRDAYDAWKAGYGREPGDAGTGGPERLTVAAAPRVASRREAS